MRAAAFLLALFVCAHAERTGTFEDVKHIVLFMQENRPLDHYDGTLAGVRGFNDRAAPLLPTGRSPFYQPVSKTPPMPADQQLCGCGACDLKWTADGAEVQGLIMNQVCSRVVDSLKSATPPVQLRNGELCSTFLEALMASSLDHLPFNKALSSSSSCASDVKVAGVPSAAAGSPEPLLYGSVAVNASYQLPYPLHFDKSSATCMPAPSMGYSWDIGMWNEGRMDAWNTAREAGYGMSHFNRSDLPFYYALKDAFTVGDQYFQSTFTATNPNRLHFFSGSNGLSAGASVDILDDSEPATGINWETMAETLEASNITWRVYMEHDDFDDNALKWFEQFKAAKPGEPLYDRGMYHADDLVAEFGKDVQNDALPQVSWIVGPTAKSEHAQNHPADGEDLTARLLKALSANPAVYAKTVFILNYDEGGQFYDHHWPPTPPVSPTDGKSTVSTVGEITKQTQQGIPAGNPIGMGFRVPLVIISPWTRGHLVFSEVSDHTSTIQFVEKRFGVHCPNISPWRRAVASDLLSAFDFKNPDFSWPELPDTKAYVNASHWQCENLPSPVVPKEQRMPTQEPGTRVLRPLPYKFDISSAVAADGHVTLSFGSSGGATGVFLVFDRYVAPHAAPRKYTVESGKQLTDSWPVWPSNGAYELHLHGSNGFVRKFSGDASSTSAGVDARLHDDVVKGDTEAVLEFSGPCAAPGWRVVDNAYGAGPWTVAPGTTSLRVPVSANGGWYDLTATCGKLARTFMGHVENPDKPGTSDPAMAIPQHHQEEHPPMPAHLRAITWSDAKACSSERSRYKDLCWFHWYGHQEL